MHRQLLIAACVLASFAGQKVFADAKPPSAPAQATVEEAAAYEHGEGVEKDQLKAAALYCEAARAGNVEAMFNLGWMYANGRGVARDDAVAAGLFATAAQHGHTQAQQMQRLVNAPNPVLPDCMRSVALLAPVADSAGVADPFIDMPPAKRKIVEAVMRAAPRYIIEPDLALAVVAAESNFQFDARSDKGAVGVMQLIPATAERFEVKNRLNIDDNVQGGLAYLRWLLAYYEGYVALAVAAYNAGEDAVDKYRGIPPYPETRAYVQRVQRLYPIERHVYDPSVVEASTILRPANSGSK